MLTIKYIFIVYVSIKVSSFKVYKDVYIYILHYIDNNKLANRYFVIIKF